MNNSTQVATVNASNKGLLSTYLLLSMTAFMVAALMGVFTAAKSGWPEAWVSALSMIYLRPLHTFVSLFAILTGMFALFEGLLPATRGRRALILQCAGVVLFLGFAGFALLSGQSTGREYFSWPLWASAPLLVSLLILVWRVFKSHSALSARSPEAYWLVGFGTLFVLNGFIESQLWPLSQRMAPSLFQNYIADLTVQWHGLDTFFAGLNTALYGSAAFLLGSKPKPLRRPWLFFVAGFSVLFTFGHHHYVSPQSSYLKMLAFIASMAAMLSFWRHVQAYRFRQPESFKHSFSYPIWRTIELWTLVSIVSGVLFAIPQVNLVIHGTYMVVMHVMGSIIGINLMIILLGGFMFAGNDDSVLAHKIKFSVRFVNYALIALWINMAAAGLVKGWMRFSHDYFEFQPIRGWFTALFPVTGFFLLVGIATLCTLCIQNWLRRSAKVESRQTETAYVSSK